MQLKAKTKSTVLIKRIVISLYKNIREAKFINTKPMSSRQNRISREKTLY